MDLQTSIQLSGGKIWMLKWRWPQVWEKGSEEHRGPERRHRSAPPDRPLRSYFHFRGTLEPLVSGTESRAEEVHTAWVGWESFRDPLFLFSASVHPHGLMDWPCTGLTSSNARRHQDMKTSVLYSQVFHLGLRKGSEDHGDHRVSDSWTQQQNCCDHFPQVEFLQMCFK